jgi:hypothetical protein
MTFKELVRRHAEAVLQAKQIIRGQNDRHIPTALSKTADAGRTVELKKVLGSHPAAAHAIFVFDLFHAYFLSKVLECRSSRPLTRSDKCVL